MAVGRNGTDGLLTGKVIQVKTRAAVEEVEKKLQIESKAARFGNRCNKLRAELYKALTIVWGLDVTEKD